MVGPLGFIELILMKLPELTIIEVWNDLPFQHHRDFMNS
jgi:hypothetical protein